MTLHTVLMGTLMAGAQTAVNPRGLAAEGQDPAHQFSSLAEMKDFSTVEGEHEASSSSTSSVSRRKDPQTLDWTDQQVRQGGVPTKFFRNATTSQFAHPRYAETRGFNDNIHFI